MTVDTDPELAVGASDHGEGRTVAMLQGCGHALVADTDLVIS